MRLNSKLFKISILFNFGCSIAFQVSPDPNQRFKQAVEKIKGDVKSPNEFTIMDDTRYEVCNKDDHVPALSEFLEFDGIQSIPRRRTFVPRNMLPAFDVDPTEYWFHNKIHTFGNTHVFGGLHASVASFATWLIDQKAYNGIDARELIAHQLYKEVNKTNAYVCDLGCGVGMSTRAIATAFQDASYICGIDTSPEMIAMAKFITKNNAALTSLQGMIQGKENSFATSLIMLLTEIKNTIDNTAFIPNCNFAIGNAERVMAPKEKFDLVTLYYAFHEIPNSARKRILREARRLLKSGGKLAVIDICPREYVPVPSMLAGEPYVLEYQQNIEEQMHKFQGFHDLEMKKVIPGHVTMWLATRN